MKIDAKTALRSVENLLTAIGGSGVNALTESGMFVMVDESYSTVTPQEVKTMMANSPLTASIAKRLSVPQEIKTMMANSPPRPPTIKMLADELGDCDDFALHLKAVMAARTRRDNMMNGTDTPPPAFGIIFSQDHALNVFVTTDERGGIYTMLSDASDPNRPITADPNKATQMLKTLPVRIVYM
ncbi:MAG: hypothetical protein WC708_02180 [Lentisphaeria bacterium]